MKVPKNKTVYIDARCYTEGEELPAGVNIVDAEIMDKPEKVKQ